MALFESSLLTNLDFPQNGCQRSSNKSHDAVMKDKVRNSSSAIFLFSSICLALQIQQRSELKRYRNNGARRVRPGWSCHDICFAHALGNKTFYIGLDNLKIRKLRQINFSGMISLVLVCTDSLLNLHRICW